MKSRRILNSIFIAAIVLAVTLGFSQSAEAATKTKRTSWTLLNQNAKDTDGDSLSDWKEENLYHTSIDNADTDGDGYSDGKEINGGYDPNYAGDMAPLQKHIYVSIKKQELKYYSGPYLIGDVLISTGVSKKDTPPGDYAVQAKYPSVLYKGVDYYFPNTKWNLNFLPHYYIHGAYWHSNFGHKMSHGCVNVAYGDMETLYNWADVGTPITITEGDFPV